MTSRGTENPWDAMTFALPAQRSRCSQGFSCVCYGSDRQRKLYSNLNREDGFMCTVRYGEANAPHTYLDEHGQPIRVEAISPPDEFNTVAALEHRPGEQVRLALHATDDILHRIDPLIEVTRE